MVGAEASADPVAPYSPGWVDRLIDAIERIPGPAWLPYVVAGSVLLALSHAVAWAEGVVTPGTFDPYQAALAMYVVLPLAAIRYLDGAALESLDRFKPALGADHATHRRLAYELTTMPVVPTLAATAVGFLALVAYVGGDPTFGGHYPNAPMSWTLTFLTTIPSVPLGTVFVYHTIRQLRAIAAIHAAPAAVNVFQLPPLHAFSGLTARTAGIILVYAYASAVADPATFTNPTLYFGTALMIGLAIVCFVVPLNGMHGRIALEKERLRSDVDARIQAAIEQLERKAANGDLSDADPSNKQLDSLIKSRTLIAAIPTWPWDPGTPRALVTAVALPIGLWLVFRGLERVLG